MAFSLPSFDQILESIVRIFKRFPLVIITSVIGTVCAITLTEISFNKDIENPELFTAIFISGLGISFFFGIATFLEQKEWDLKIKWGIRAGGVLLLVLYYFLLGDSMLEGPYEVNYRYVMYLLTAHLFVAFAPFIGTSKMDEFWEYNKTLFLRILISALYSGVLFTGLSVALLAIQNLLDIDINPETYLQLFIFLAGIFNTWFFLSGIPEGQDIAVKELVFPKGLRLFSQYVLIPLVTVYILILYLYMGKIIVQWELPNGWVSNLVLTFSIAGVLSLLLLYPIRNSLEHVWVKIYSKGYYLALLPLVGLLMFSIWVRISDYGVTINRFYVATLGVWLTIIVLYFIFSRSKSIKFIPASLFVITLLVSFGPLGAFAVSERSQSERFNNILEEYGMLNDQGLIRETSDSVSWEDRKELSSIADYITENHGNEGFERYFEEELPDSVNAQMILRKMGLDYLNRWADPGMGTSIYFEYSVSNEIMISVADYDLSIPLVEIWSGKTEMLYTIDNTEWILTNDPEEFRFTLSESTGKETLDISYSDLKEVLMDKYGTRNTMTPFSEMSLVSENEDLKVLTVFTFLSGTETLSRAEANLYIKIKE